MSRKIYRSILCLVVAVGWVAVAHPRDIAVVVEDLNRAAFAAIRSAGADAEDGWPWTLPQPVAWTVINPGAQRGGCAIDVAVLGASTAEQVNDVVASLTGDPRIATITGISITATTPTLAELQAFDSVVVFTNSTPQDSVTLGDHLADYLDGGGGIALAMFAMNAAVNIRTVEGRFLTADYYCIEHSVGSPTLGHATLGAIHVPASPLLQNVSTFDGGSSSFRSPAPLNPSATRIADWSTGEILIAERSDLNGGRVDLGFFAVSELGASTSWLATTDGAALLRNAVVVASRCGAACPGDLNGDSVVDLTDLAVLLAHFGTLGGATLEDGDVNADGDVDLEDLAILLGLFGTSCP